MLKTKMYMAKPDQEVKNAHELSSDINIKYGRKKALDGTIRKVPIKVADGSIIKLFDKTPFPEEPNDVVCPHFFELKWANGCYFNCAWCYLQGTFRFRPMKKKPYLKDMNKIKSHLLSFFENVEGGPYMLNSGELSDSLLFEHNGYSLSEHIIPLFVDQDKHKLLILSKSSNVSKLIEYGPTDRVVVSFSVNAEKVADRWEKGAPPVSLRLQAAREVQDAGFELRLRIDPMVPVENWSDYYGSLLEKIFDEYELRPSRITLGSLRGLQSTINNAWDKSWVDYLDENSNWGKKISKGKRLAMYSFIKNKVKIDYGYTQLAFCKETIDLWNKLDMDYKKIKCNCML
jgi:spore photoproduct lyase